MVSVILLSTEEVLLRNAYWSRLDSLWSAEELEPFEDIKPEDLFIKPLSRDTYYTRFPDILRSDSEEENSISLTGFKNKYSLWRSRILIKKVSDRRKSQVSRSSNVSSKSLESSNREVEKVKTETSQTNEEKIKAFIEKLQQSIPPPPLEELNRENKSTSIYEDILQGNGSLEFDIEIPKYEEFASPEFLIKDSSVPYCSTFKRRKNNPAELIKEDSLVWYETIYGVSDLVDDDFNYTLSSSLENSINNITTMSTHTYENIEFPLLVAKNKVQNEEFQSITTDESGDYELYDKTNKSEELISKSHCLDEHINFTPEEDSITEYAKFAVNKIYQTLKLEQGMRDSSSLQDLAVVDENGNVPTTCDLEINKPYFSDIYRLTHVIDNEDMVIE